MNEQLISHHKIVQDAEIMTKGEFIQEHGEQYLEYYEQVQENGDKKTNFYEGGIEYSKYLEEKNNVPEKKSFRDEFTVDDLDPYGNLI